MSSARNWLLISETFKSIQGEGPSAGQLAYFVRLGSCNLHCTWCDTAYTWAFSERLAGFTESRTQYVASHELRRVQLVALGSEILESGAGLCVITGGEPMLQQDTLVALVRSLKYTMRYEIETSGTLAPPGIGGLGLLDYSNVSFNVSPKLGSSGNELELRYRPDILRQFSESKKAIFKFVIDTRPGHYADADRDLTEVLRIVTEVGIPRDRVWLMPCGSSEKEISDGLRMLANVAVDSGFNLTGRMHVTIWGDKRGR